MNLFLQYLWSEGGGGGGEGGGQGGEGRGTQRSFNIN